MTPRPIIAAIGLAACAMLTACTGPTPAPPAASTALPGASSPSAAPGATTSASTTPSAGPSATPPASATGSMTTAGALTAIPAAFLGKWNFVRKDCGKPGSEGQLTVEARRVSFYESSGEVTSVSQGARNVITVELAMSSEGDTWTDTLRFQLTDGGRRLTSLSTNTVRYRCP